ncbi:hypothetical protein CDAR_188931 [Caerostris darwini]|uniref:Uncharacterized protein n=1 Tax=Caerostris darwini TaxID=1538125 RepID=A0AAV4VYL2_9ARAC|nr:hypothetical protein CDAR_188931 [Caerostris darwini]
MRSAQPSMPVVMAGFKADSCDNHNSFQVHRNTTSCGKTFPPYVAAQLLDGFAGEVVNGCRDMVASCPKCQ